MGLHCEGKSVLTCGRIGTCLNGAATHGGSLRVSTSIVAGRTARCGLLDAGLGILCLTQGKTVEEVECSLQALDGWLGVVDARNWGGSPESGIQTGAREQMSKEKQPG